SVRGNDGAHLWGISRLTKRGRVDNEKNENTGIVTIHVDGRQYILYPGDCIQIHSNEEHNWRNCTNRTARLLSVNVPNPFRHPEEGHIMPL
ncbi:MAG: cupin domain-containing protein, partial [Lachnospiraceae bacterium]|nr:cupin domain-containing protein [Lachnospiraceae bacterium]